MFFFASLTKGFFMFFQAPTHKNNVFDIQIRGNFRDSKDSFYSISENDFVHITFIKREDNSIWEEVRPLMILESIDEFFLQKMNFQSLP